MAMMKFSFLLFSVAVIIVPTSLFAQSTPSVSQTISLINQERISRGLSPLLENLLLEKAATEKVAQSVQSGILLHSSAPFGVPWSTLQNVGYTYRYAGENLAVHLFTASDIVSHWMNSPLHRENILNPVFKEVGVAFGSGTHNGDPSIYTVAYFGTPKEVLSSASPTPSPTGSLAKEDLMRQLVLLLTEYIRLLSLHNQT